MAQGAGRQRSGKSAATGTSKAGGAEQNGRSDAGTAGQGMVDLEFLRGLIEAVDQSGIDTLEINRAGTRIRIAKTPAGVPVASFPSYAPQPTAPAPAAASPTPVARPVGGAAPSEPAPAAAPDTSHLTDVKSPMVGTFYRAPAPDAPSYVEVGSSVSKGQTLCILEAMKLMNEMECEVDGVVREILVDDADPVEFGQVLFRIEPSGSK